MNVEQVNKSYIYYNESTFMHIRQYYLYCVGLLRKTLAQTDVAINIIIGNYKIKFPNKFPTYKIDIQYEHTLVKQGGRDVEEAVIGSVTTTDGTPYLVRIANFKYYASLDFVVDYSKPNIVNINESGKFERYLKKCTHISPLLYDFKQDYLMKNRSKQIVTTFIDENEQRRKLLMDNLRSANLPYSNETNCFSNKDVETLYTDTKILLNIHQTPHHETFEELRVLPALLCGCIVISEDVPLKEHIPYSKFIIWTNYKSIIEKTKQVSDNYNYYFNKIFITGGLLNIINTMEKENYENIKHIISYIDRSRANEKQENPLVLFWRKIIDGTK